MTVRRRLRQLYHHWTVKEALATIKLSWPIAVAFFLQQVIYTVSLAFSGHIQEDSGTILEAVGLAVSIIGVTGLCIGIGLCVAVDTLGSQAWGAQNYKKIGIYIQRGILLLGLMILMIYAFWFNAESLLHILHQPPCVIDYTVQYIHVYSCALPAVFLYTILQRYLQVQNIVYPFVITGVIANTVNAVAHYLFLFVANWGVRGAAGAVALTWYTYLFSLLIIIYVRKLHVKTWGGWSRECLKDWGQFARYGIPGFVMLFAEWGTFESGFVLTGIVGRTQQTIYVLITSWLYILFMFPMSISVAASIRIGNELGAGNPKKAKKAFFVSACFTLVWVVFITTVNLALKSYIPLIFTSDLDAVSLVSTPMIVSAIICIADHSQILLGGVLRGLGRQGLGAVGNVVAFWVIGIPLGIGLLFGVKMGAVGFLTGLAVASSSQLVFYAIIIAITNWRKQSEKAQRIAGVKKIKIEENFVGDTNAVASEDEIPLQLLSEDEDIDTPGDPAPSTTTTMYSFSGNGKLVHSGDDVYDNTVSDDVGILYPSSDLEDELNSGVESESETSMGVVSDSDFQNEKEDTNEGEVDQNPPKVVLSRKTVVVRVFTVLAFVSFFVASVVLSQVYVYKPTTCEYSNLTNITSNFTTEILNNDTTLSF